ncbi:hypothetical protein [Gloeothece verrucosa]|uniref:Uncharacterized protein n=1 Tax=Gloeothece verrucosa (strain PCC 7822) TaxID=497965 RepID=E0UMM7_GLOV7|nr:hypothetical protein [Gloeothece verrucosa]ADN18207.1 hypothetical protein Cyan7822_6423 [Gloeothece verrucosa PCC 7822]
MLQYSPFPYSSISPDNPLKHIFIAQCYTPLINPTFALTHYADLLLSKCSDAETQQLTERIKQQVKEIDLVVKRFLLFIDQPPQWEQLSNASPNQIIREVLQILNGCWPSNLKICSDFDECLDKPLSIPVYLLEALSFHLLSSSLESLSIDLQSDFNFEPFVHISTQFGQDKWLLIIEDNSRSKRLHSLAIEQFLVQAGGEINFFSFTEKPQFILSFPITSVFD